MAASKQAARAELAVALQVGYAQVLLALVKAFERIPHFALVREASALGNLGCMVKLAVATYRSDGCSGWGRRCRKWWWLAAG